MSVVHPAYTSIIGRYKYKNYFGVSAHTAASLVIARRANKLKDRVPNHICGVLHRGDANEFEKIRLTRHQWSHWSYVNKNFVKCLGLLNKLDSSCSVESSGSSATSVNNLTARFNPNK